jgi:catechol 1,2-dioxygenase
LDSCYFYRHIPGILDIYWMQRRSFIKNAAYGVVVVSTSGFIHFDGERYVGDCETTTDIIGPFYRPNAPLKTNFIIPGDPGVPVELSGVVRHGDCMTPYNKAKIELWHCANSGLYDNDSEEYRYRGTTFTDEEGRYLFNTILPVPYNAAGGPMRPAHFHLMITAAGYQPLITQLYFTNDPYIDKDPFSMAPTAKKRILTIGTFPDGKKKVLYDINMSEKLDVEPSSLEKLTGNYTCQEQEEITSSIFVWNKRLWENTVYGKKLDPFGRPLDYIGNNTFQSPGQPVSMSNTCQFEINESGSVKYTQTIINARGNKYVFTFVKKG